MNIDLRIKEFWALFTSLKDQALFYDELPEEEAESLLEALQSGIRLIHPDLYVKFFVDQETDAYVLQIYDDGTPEVSRIGDQVLEQSPEIAPWDFWRETVSVKGLPLFEYNPPDPDTPESEGDPFLAGVSMSIRPVIPMTGTLRFNLSIHMNAMDSERSRDKLKAWIMLLLGTNQYDRWVESITFVGNQEMVPHDAFPFTRSDLWIDFMDNYHKML